jgi:hypothetical protein
MENKFQTGSFLDFLKKGKIQKKSKWETFCVQNSAQFWVICIDANPNESRAVLS